MLHKDKKVEEERMSLTNTDGCEEPDGGIRWLALWEERFDGVDGEGESNDGNRSRPHNDALHPQTHERQEPPEGDHDVGIVRSWIKSIKTSVL